MEPAPHDRTLQAAQGYLELGMVDDALAELDSLPIAARERVEVLHLRCSAHIQARRWPEALQIGQLVCQLDPQGPPGFLQAAFCLHELGRTREAREVLLGGPSSLLNEATYHYNLGCYDAALGQHRGSPGPTCASASSSTKSSATSPAPTPICARCGTVCRQRL